MLQLNLKKIAILVVIIALGVVALIFTKKFDLPMWCFETPELSSTSERDAASEELINDLKEDLIKAQQALAEAQQVNAAKVIDAKETVVIKKVYIKNLAEKPKDSALVGFSNLMRRDNASY